MEKLDEETEQKIDEALKVEKWKSFVSGKVAGGLAVLDVLDIEKDKRIGVMAEALGLSIATASDFVNDFYAEKNVSN